MGGGDQVRPRLLGGFLKEGVAHLPGGLLKAGSPQAGLGGHVAGAGVQRNGGQDAPVPAAMDAAAQLDKLLHKPLVPVGLLPRQPVVVVGGGQAEAELVPQAVEDVEHGDGVRPAGHGAQHCGPGRNQVLLPDQVFNRFQQRQDLHFRQGRTVSASRRDTCQLTGAISVTRWKFVV